MLNKATVIFQDDSRHAAKVIGRDEKADIALLKIGTNEILTYVTWGKGDDAKVGDWVVAVGNPFGLGAREPSGSSPRWGATSNGARTTISCQIDAPINRGNSGGPTFNLHGQVIGTNPAIYSVSGGSVRIGFGAPANIAKASSRPAQGTLDRQPPLSSANLAVCDGDRAVAASPNRIDTARRCDFRSALRASAGKRRAWPVQGTISRLRLDHHSTCPRF